jgi:phosphate starvation-inducible PhoH-like protein
MEIVEKKIRISDVDALTLFGINDANLQVIEQRYDANVIVRGETIVLRGEADDVAQIEHILREMIAIANKVGLLSTRDVETVVEVVRGGSRMGGTPRELEDTPVLLTRTGFIRARTAGQKNYVDLARANDIVFAIGPAGTGKTYLAVAMAVAALRAREVSKLVLARPAVEAGESLGFLPGDIREKIDPYLRPLYDALEEMLTGEKLKSYLEKNVIEIVPLAYMRGRTLNNAFVILDEAQNATSMQMKMFLTRLGSNSRAIITGDVTQIDLPPTATSGLVDAQQILQHIEGIGFVSFDKSDVVRHRLVKDIIDAYGKRDVQLRNRTNGDGDPGNAPPHMS